MAFAVPRSALTYTMNLPADYGGDTVHAYMSFVAADGKMASNSKYLGIMVII